MNYLRANEHSRGLYFSSFLLAFESASVVFIRDLRSAKTLMRPLLRTTWQLALKTWETGLRLATYRKRSLFSCKSLKAGGQYKQSHLVEYFKCVCKFYMGSQKIYPYLWTIGLLQSPNVSLFRCRSLLGTEKWISSRRNGGKKNYIIRATSLKSCKNHGVLIQIYNWRELITGLLKCVPKKHKINWKVLITRE